MLLPPSSVFHISGECCLRSGRRSTPGAKKNMILVEPASPSSMYQKNEKGKSILQYRYKYLFTSFNSLFVMLGTVDSRPPERLSYVYCLRAAARLFVLQCSGGFLCGPPAVHFHGTEVICRSRMRVAGYFWRGCGEIVFPYHSDFSAGTNHSTKGLCLLQKGVQLKHEQNGVVINFLRKLRVYYPQVFPNKMTWSVERYFIHTCPVFGCRRMK